MHINRVGVLSAFEFFAFTVQKKKIKNQKKILGELKVKVLIQPIP